MYKGQKIKFMQVNKITEHMFNAYKSSIKEISISDFGEFLSLYGQVYDGKMAKIISNIYLNNENNNYYCDIFINDEERKVFLELIKHFTNMKFHVILDENLFTL